MSYDKQENNLKKLKTAARELFNVLYPTTKEENEHAEFLNETLEHLIVMDGMYITVTKDQIKDMLLSNNLIELSRKARNIKYAKH